MKNIVLLVIITLITMSFTSINSVNKKQEGIDRIEKKVDPEFCWTFADAVELNNCGYADCNFDVWEYAYNECMGLN